MIPSRLLVMTNRVPIVDSFVLPFQNNGDLFDLTPQRMAIHILILLMVVAGKRRDRQVVRILGILGTLLEGGHPSVYQLARRFGTRRETIYRDMRALEDAGYPLTGDDQG